MEPYPASLNWLLPLIALILLLCAGLFAMAEAALLALRPSRVDQLVEERRRGAAQVKRLVDDPPRYIATAQVGVTLLGFSAAAVAAAAALLWTEPRGQQAPPPISTRVVAIVLTTAVTGLLAMIVAGLAPKSLAVQAPHTWALRLAPLLGVFSIVFRPLSALVLGGSRLLVMPFGAQVEFQTPLITREEFEQILDSTGKRGEIDDDEAQIIARVIEFSERDIRSIMTPRIDLSALPIDAPLDRVIETVVSSGHSRLPVFEGTIDNVVGILHAKDLLPRLRDPSRPFALKSIVRPAYFIAESMPVPDLLAAMRRSNQQVAIVQDEYAGTEGLVTLEDLLEEIVGDIKDEYDRDEPEIRVISERETLLDGRVSIADVNERLGLGLSDEDYRSIGGYVQGVLGHEPEAGEVVEAEGVILKVDRVEGRRVMLRAVRREGDEADGEERE